MTVQDTLDLLNKGKTLPELPLASKWQSVFIQASLHLRGYQPSFTDLSRDRGGEVRPANWGGKDYDDYFNTFLFSRHPRENVATRQWRLSQYRPRTKAPLLRLVEEMQGSIFADSQYQLTLPDADDQKYFDGNNFDGHTLVGWVARNVPAVVEDPNGFALWLPKYSRLEAPAGKLELTLHFVNRKDVLFYDERSIAFTKGNTAWFIDEREIYKLMKNKEGLWEKPADVYYVHLMDRLPVKVVGGIWNTEGYYNSFFDKAFPVCDDFVSTYSASQMIDKEASHPYIIMAMEDCPTCHGAGKVQKTCLDCPGGEELATCPSCNGNKKISFNPADRYEVPKEMMSADVIKIVNPDININDYHAKKQKELFQEILDALNMQFVDEAQSGTAKTLDRDNLYKFISNASNHFFDNIIGPLLDFGIMYRNVQATADEIGIKPQLYAYTLVKPTQFKIKSSGELMAEFGEANKSGLPAFVRRQIALEFSDKRFGGDLIFQQKAKVIIALDDLSIYSSEEKLNMVASGEASLSDILFSRKLPGMIDGLIREKGDNWFLKVSIADLQALIDEMRQKLPVPVAPATPIAEA